MVRLYIHTRDITDLVSLNLKFGKTTWNRFSRFFTRFGTIYTYIRTFVPLNKFGKTELKSPWHLLPRDLFMPYRLILTLFKRIKSFFLQFFSFSSYFTIYYSLENIYNCFWVNELYLPLFIKKYISFFVNFWVQFGTVVPYLGTVYI